MVARSIFVDPVTFCSWEGGGLLLSLSPSPHLIDGQMFATTSSIALVEPYVTFFSPENYISRNPFLI